ncbi:MAG: hypothetical protein IPN91_01475 [Holophagaceae bacterium]|jgi:hypothetical protein|uniref:Uncharacterized protein n=1 Tax=Candidatus Geothrix odensensis TaxID=2954440 RepID=A0A936EZH7_9BACT|nr:hypothetical protein [Candidatus Geothrix odensensis]MBK8571315.1 hypothetical protein [Candidatus Geothrix odensensis]
MHYTPSTNPGNLGFALLGGALGGFIAIIGLKAIFRREFKTGKRRGYKTLYGKEAIYNGLFFLFVGLVFVVFGLLSLIEFNHLH